MEGQQQNAGASPAPGAKPILTPSFQLFKPSMRAINTNLGVFISLYLLPFLLAIVFVVALATGSSGGSADAHSSSIAAGIVLIVAGLAVALVLSPALILTQVKSVRGQTVGLGEVLKGALHFSIRYILLAICISLLVIFGLILFIVPGVIMIRRYMLSPYYLVDRDISVGEAMKLSAAETKPVSGYIYGVLGVNLLLGLLGIIPVIGGLFGSILQILYSAAPAVRYLEISDLNDYRPNVHSGLAAHTAPPINPVQS